MSSAKPTLDELKDEINQIRKVHRALKDDSAFALWFLRAFLADSEESAKAALTGDTGDKNVDAILIDPRSKQVHVVQGKFHLSIGEVSEKRNDVLGFADLGLLPWESKEVLDAFYSRLAPIVRDKFQDLVRTVKAGSDLRLYYVTTGRCTDGIRREAKERVRQAEGDVQIMVFDGWDVMTIFKDYLEGVAPAIPTMTLKIVPEGSGTDSVIHRFEPEKQIESWVFSMSARDVGEMFGRAGVRLFARNVRGYLGELNEINDAMAETVRSEPHNFWYYNNGVTIVCDDAKRETQGGEDVLRVERPQVINGQQTTRTLHRNPSERARALMRVIKIPRNAGDDDEYDDLVSAIVRATNWQNAIRPSDLISNDHVQIFLEREFRKRGYQYLRKRQTKSEARAAFGGSAYWQIKKEELAQAVGACMLDPAIVRRGKEGLFTEQYYRSIFGARSLSFYLSRYWLMSRVQASAWGKPRRAYAKWVVLHFAWDRISKDIGAGLGEQKFRYACEERSWDVLGPLDRSLDALF